jgi:glucose dehydrogenase
LLLRSNRRRPCRSRGVATFLDRTAPADAPCRNRILYGNWQFRVYAIDVRNGKRCAGFGRNGEVELDAGKPQVMVAIQIARRPRSSATSPFGSLIADGYPLMRRAAKSGARRARAGTPARPDPAQRR